MFAAQGAGSNRDQGGSWYGSIRAALPRNEVPHTVCRPTRRIARSPSPQVTLSEALQRIADSDESPFIPPNAAPELKDLLGRMFEREVKGSCVGPE